MSCVVHPNNNFALSNQVFAGQASIMVSLTMMEAGWMSQDRAGKTSSSNHTKMDFSPLGKQSVQD